MAYNEIEQRGTADFPFAFFHVDSGHSRYNMSAHWHSEFELVRILEGEFHITLNNVPYVAKKGDVVFINSETVHQGIPKDCVYECVVFDADYIYYENYDNLSFIKSIIDREYTVNEYYPYQDSELHRAFNDIFDAIISKTCAHKFRVISALYTVFAIISEQKLYVGNIGNDSALNDNNIAKLKKTLSFIRENYDKPITLDMIAAEVNMSPKYLGSFFKSMTEKTPIDYLIEYRIEKAARKLRLSDMSVTDIAYSCGFSDLSYFIKTFKSIKGSSPGKFRNM
ncbi:MAG: helix-turn-helix transcriptional regulator [Clostridia bacterium]|nr:helix-turn-helix transcriptional regulator [Clostridia bacterium]